MILEKEACAVATLAALSWAECYGERDIFNANSIGCEVKALEVGHREIVESMDVFGLVRDKYLKFGPNERLKVSVFLELMRVTAESLGMEIMGHLDRAAKKQLEAIGGVKYSHSVRFQEQGKPQTTVRARGYFGVGVCAEKILEDFSDLEEKDMQQKFQNLAEAVGINIRHSLLS